MVCIYCGFNPEFKGAECCKKCLKIYYPSPNRENIHGVVGLFGSPRLTDIEKQRNKELNRNKTKHTIDLDERRKRAQKRKDELKHIRDSCKLSVGDVDILKNKDTCDTLKDHHEDLKHDPESLSTEFIQQLIGSKCK